MMATRGLVLLAKDTFSGVSSVSFDNVFSATYKKYRIIINISSPSGAYTYMRLRASGTDDSSGNYARQYLFGDNTNVDDGRVTSATQWDGPAELNTYENISIVEVLNPFQSTYTTAFSRLNDTSAGNIILVHVGFGMAVTTSYDGFTLFPNTSTISGTITVYGLAQ